MVEECLSILFIASGNHMEFNDAVNNYLNAFKEEIVGKF